MTPLLILVGPTGVGKTAVAIELCEILQGEIVSADSLQIYRGLEIGTAKATRDEQARAPHHLVDIRNANETYSAAQWASDARGAIEDIRARGKTPIVCGGTGFYIRALLQPETLAAAPPNSKLRAQLQNEASQFGAEWLHQQLEKCDAAAAARLHPNDVFRVIRALEVAHCNRQKVHPKAGVLFGSSIFALTMDRAKLYARLNARTDAMLERGFMGELESLINGAPQSPALSSIGYKQMLPALLDSEKFDACLESWERDTRRYAKRQMTWFRHQIEAQWIEADEISLTDCAETIASQWRVSTAMI